jgi:hypothetical protein
MDPRVAMHQRIIGEDSAKLTDLFNQFANSSYQPIDQISMELAERTTLQRYPLFITPKEFFVISDVDYSHETKNINKSTAGCGYVFYDNEKTGQIYYTLFTLDNYARLTQVRNHYWDGIAHIKNDSLNLESPNGKAQILLMLLGDRAVFAVNGKIVIDQTVEWQSEGYFGFSLLSGTNKDYGTRCIFKNTEILIK